MRGDCCHSSATTVVWQESLTADSWAVTQMWMYPDCSGSFIEQPYSCTWDSGFKGSFEGPDFYAQRLSNCKMKFTCHVQFLVPGHWPQICLPDFSGNPMCCGWSYTVPGEVREKPSGDVWIWLAEHYHNFLPGCFPQWESSTASAPHKSFWKACLTVYWARCVKVSHCF